MAEAASSTPAFVVSVGARSTLGLSALQAAMLVRARRGDPQSLPLRDKRGRPIGACTAKGVPAGLSGCDRLVALGAPALRAAVPRQAPSGTWPVILAVPEKGRPDDDPRLDGAIVQALAEASGVAIDEGRSRTVRAGHAGAAIAVAAALDAVHAGAPAVVVGGVDSHVHPEVLAWLDAECRLHAMGAENGFIPGEGAGFLVISARPGAASGPPALVRAAKIGYEESVTTDAPNIGQAMTAILRDLALAAPGGRLAWALTDVNGERHRVREWRLASGRGAFADGAVHHRPADDLGDLGAATGAVLGAMAYELFRAGAAPASTACVALSSDGPERGAFLLSFEGAGAQGGGR